MARRSSSTARTVSRLARAMAWAEARGKEQGLRGASSVWLAIWVLATAYRRIKQWSQPEPVIVRERLLPGQQLLISHHLPGTELEPLPDEPRRLRRRRAR